MMLAEQTVMGNWAASSSDGQQFWKSSRNARPGVVALWLFPGPIGEANAQTISFIPAMCRSLGLRTVEHAGHRRR
jgi:hypothetical protein